MTVWLPELSDVVRFHTMVSEATGGADGVREAGLIDSALARASAAFAGVEAYPDVIGKAAAAGCGLVQNHGFIDGNKRIGVAVMLLILRRNGVTLRYTQDELARLGLGLAQGLFSVPETIRWIEDHRA